MRLRSRLLCATVMIVAIVLVQSHAARAEGPKLEPAPFRLAAPGTVFHWRSSSGATHDVVVGRSEGFLANWTSDGDLRSLYLPSCARRGYLNGDDVAEFGTIWPLSLGKVVKFQRHSPTRDGAWEDEVSVIDTETLRIADKEIDTYVVRSKSHGMGGNTWNATATFWFAPSLGWYVKYQYADSTGKAVNEKVFGYEIAR
jgi:hypothetical protein